MAKFRKPKTEHEATFSRKILAFKMQKCSVHARQRIVSEPLSEPRTCHR